MELVRYSSVETPWGRFVVGWSKVGIVSLHFPSRQPPVPLRPPGEHVLRLREQLREYLAGDRKNFDIPLDLAGTPFQMAVWEALLEIPYGHTVTYGELAKRIGRPGAARAVGNAVGANPVPILIPCHRVVPKSGGIGNFGPGPEWKARLLRLEGALGKDVP